MAPLIHHEPRGLCLTPCGSSIQRGIRALGTEQEGCRDIPSESRGTSDPRKGYDLEGVLQLEALGREGCLHVSLRLRSLSIHQGALGPFCGGGSAPSFFSKGGVTTITNRARPHRELTQTPRTSASPCEGLPLPSGTPLETGREYGGRYG